MKYIAIIIILLISVGLILKLTDKGEPEAYLALEAAQQNPFKVHRDSASVVWFRGIQFLKERKRLIAGGELIHNDSTLIIPYSNSHEKGSSIKLEMHSAGDSVEVTAYWWYSRSLEIDGGKEIALFMQKGISKYDY